MLCQNMNEMNFDPTHHYIYRVKYKSNNDVMMEFSVDHHNHDVYIALVLKGEYANKQRLLRLMRNAGLLNVHFQPTFNGLEWMDKIVANAIRKSKKYA